MEFICRFSFWKLFKISKTCLGHKPYNNINNNNKFIYFTKAHDYNIIYIYLMSPKLG